MSEDHQEDPDALRQSLETMGQGHVFAFWDSLNAARRQELLSDLISLNINAIPALMKLVTKPRSAADPHLNLNPPVVVHKRDLGPEQSRLGKETIAAGRVCAFTVAGGQGTRLGFDGPKGAFPISPVRQKPLFQLFGESILGTNKRYGCSLHWYLMTSPLNDTATRQFFSDHACFGLSPDHVHFFQQGVMPAFDPQGRMLLEHKHRLALSPDGHGGSLLALAQSGMLAHMSAQGIEHISYFQVDNPLVHPIDPAFIGLHVSDQSEMSSKTLSKADDLERVGNFVLQDGKLGVIEYSDLSEELARARNADGSRKFNAANIAIHILSRRFVERLTADRASFALPWHLADKKVPHVEPATGQRVDPVKPNAIKLEAFIFDALPLARRAVLLETSRAEEFSPVKNATGVDSVQTARRDMNRLAARWLDDAGLPISRAIDGEPDGLFEISPLYALDDAHLIERGVSGVQTPSAGSRLYIE
jgi:UDP-N-acetylglucosamine/UDP-N-acetylgalactosamine diphosphorylase